MPRAFTKEVEEAIDWFAAEFKYLKQLHASLEKIKEEKATQQRKDLKAALKVARYVGKAERRAEKPLQDILSILSKIPDTTLHKTLKEMEIPERKLIREGSFYVGSLRKGLKHARTNISIYENYPSGSLEQQIQVEISKLRVEVEELETWVTALERGLQIVESWLQQNVPGISRRKLIKSVAAGAALGALSLSPLKAFAGTDIETKIRALPLRKDSEYESSLKKYLAEKGTYDYARQMSEVNFQKSEKLSMSHVQTLWHYKRGVKFVTALLALGWDQRAIENYAINSAATDAYLIKFAQGLTQKLGRTFFTPDQISYLADYNISLADIVALANLFNNPENVVQYVSRGGTLEYARQLQEQGFDPEFIYASVVLGKDSGLKRFKDTSKPNAVIIIAQQKSDPKRAIAPENMKKFIIEIMKGYDILIKIAGNIQDVRDAIHLVYQAGGQENLKLLVLAGHGNKTSLQLGKWGRKAMITVDSDLRDPLSKLAEDARIVLVSCSTGEGMEKGKNLANHILKQATNLRRGIAERVIFAPGFPVAVRGMKIKSLYPLELIITGFFRVNEKGEKVVLGLDPVLDLSYALGRKYVEDDITYRATPTLGMWLRGK